MTAKSHVAVVGFFIALLPLVAADAAASAQSGPFPEQPETFASFAACRRSLEARHEESLEWLRSRRSNTDTSWTDRSFDSEGVVNTGKEAAEYDERRIESFTGNRGDGLFISSGLIHVVTYRCMGNVRSGETSSIAVPGDPEALPHIGCR